MCKKVPAEVIREIQAVGYLAEINIVGVRKLSKVTVENNYLYSLVFALGSETGIILDVRISADRPTHIIGFGEFELDGAAWNVEWIEEESKLYRFHRWLDYPRNIVINHCTGNRGRVAPGFPIQGLLLGRSENSVPHDSRQSDLPARLAIEVGSEISYHDLRVRFDHEVGGIPKLRKSSLFEPGESPSCWPPREELDGK